MLKRSIEALLYLFGAGGRKTRQCYRRASVVWFQSEIHELRICQLHKGGDRSNLAHTGTVNQNAIWLKTRIYFSESFGQPTAVTALL